MNRWAPVAALLLVGCAIVSPAPAPSTKASLTTSEVARAGAVSTFPVVREWPSAITSCGKSSGSGVHLGNGVVLTAAHVIYSLADAAAKCPDGNTTFFGKLSTAVVRVEGYVARVIALDPDLDLALLGVPDLVGRASLAWGNTDALSIGDQVVAVGFPQGGQSVVSGIVSAFRTVRVPGRPTPITLIQTDAAVNPGNSGGPLLNMAGELIGIVDSRVEGGGVQGQNFSVASTTARPWVEEVRGR